MALEKKWLKVDPKPFTADGGENGYVYLSNVKGFRIRQRVLLKATGLPNIEADIINVYPDRLIIGHYEEKRPVDISAYTVALSATVEASEQDKQFVSQKDLISFVHEREGINAIRVFNVDEEGKPYNETNPLFVRLSDGSISIGTVNAEIEVQLSRKDGAPDSGDVHDSVRIGNQNYELSFTANDDESKAAADVVALNRFIDAPLDDAEIVQFTADGDPEIIEIRENNTLKMTLTCFYNSEGDLYRVRRTRA
jgi:hypothetical protein